LGEYANFVAVVRVRNRPKDVLDVNDATCTAICDCAAIYLFTNVHGAEGRAALYADSRQTGVIGLIDF
jgi:hypothetical protein